MSFCTGACSHHDSACNKKMRILASSQAHTTRKPAWVQRKISLLQISKGAAGQKTRARLIQAAGLRSA